MKITGETDLIIAIDENLSCLKNTGYNQVLANMDTSEERAAPFIL